jgi:hypothetical protein
MESRINLTGMLFVLSLIFGSYTIVYGSKEIPEPPQWERSIESFSQEKKQKRKHEIETKKRKSQREKILEAVTKRLGKTHIVSPTIQEKEPLNLMVLLSEDGNIFSQIVKTSTFAVIVSKKDLLAGLSKDIKNTEFFNADRWLLYWLCSTNYYVIIPKERIDNFNAIFTVSKSKKFDGIDLSENIVDLNHFLPDSKNILDFTKLIDHLKQENIHGVKNKIEGQYDKFVEFLRKLFKKPNIEEDFVPPHMNMFVIGHGLRNSHIMGFTFKEFQRLMTFLQQMHKQNIIRFDSFTGYSCYIGGKNQAALVTFFEENNMPLGPNSYDFPIFICGSDEVYLTTTSGFEINKVAYTGFDFEMLFFMINRVKQGKESWEHVAKFLIEQSYPNEGDMHNYTQTPKILWPGALHFTSFNVDGYTTCIGNASYQKYKEEKKAVTIDKTSAFVLLPINFDIPLMISPFYVPKGILAGKMAKGGDEKFFIEDAMTLWRRTFSLDDFILNISRNIEEFHKQQVMVITQENIQQAKNVIDKKLLIKEDKDKFNTYFSHETIQKIVNRCSILYPKYIPGNQLVDTFIFKKIIVLDPFEDATLPPYGVLKFIRDAFFDVRRQKIWRTFLIKHLEGANDIFDTLVFLALLGKAFDDDLLSIVKNKPKITLKNVILKNRGIGIDDKSDIEGTISFVIDDKAWKFSWECADEARWNFEKVSIEEHLDAVKKIKKEVRHRVSEIEKKGYHYTAPHLVLVPGHSILHQNREQLKEIDARQIAHSLGSLKPKLENKKNFYFINKMLNILQEEGQEYKIQKIFKNKREGNQITFLRNQDTTKKPLIFKTLCDMILSFYSDQLSHEKIIFKKKGLYQIPKQTIIIDSFEGFNDMSLLIEFDRLNAKNNVPNKIKKLLPHDTSLALKNILIMLIGTVEERSDEKKNEKEKDKDVWDTLFDVTITGKFIGNDDEEHVFRWKNKDNLGIRLLEDKEQVETYEKLFEAKVKKFA